MGPTVEKTAVCKNLLGRGLLMLRQREIVIDRTCALNGSEYEWGVHIAFFAAKVKFTPATPIA
jgi:hypothetical protein